jgi:hypothetical protein
VEGHVDGRVAVVGVVLLPEADRAYDRPVVLDGEPAAVEQLVRDPLAIEAGPPLGDAGRGQDVRHPLDVAGVQEPEAHALAGDLRASMMTRDGARACPGDRRRHGRSASDSVPAAKQATCRGRCR